jgi:hypothetical protein
MSQYSRRSFEPIRWATAPRIRSTLVEFELLGKDDLDAQAGGPRSMGFLLSEVAAFEQRFRAPASELDFDADQQEHDDHEPNLLPEVPACLPAAKKAMPLRKVA